MRLAILDYGMGNLRSVEKALEHVGASPEVTRDHDRIRAADGVVLPGVGAFPKAVTAVRDLGLDDVLQGRVDQRVPILGICLGLQLLFESSTEMGGARGLGLLAGEVRELAADGLKIPQIGWNSVSWRHHAELAEDLPNPSAFYHVHSYAPIPTDADDVIGTAVYGTEFATAVARPPVYGVQFHPEKSGPDGLRLLGNFVRICASVRAA